MMKYRFFLTNRLFFSIVSRSKIRKSLQFRLQADTVKSERYPQDSPPERGTANFCDLLLFSVIPAKIRNRCSSDETMDSCFRRNDRELRKVTHGVIFIKLIIPSKCEKDKQVTANGTVKISR
jgi:hypothetical protein